MPTSKGYRRKTRSLFTRRRSKGLTPFMREYKPDSKVVILIDPSEVKGMPHRRFHGRIGVVKEVRRRSLVLKVQVGGKIKEVVTRLNHVKPHMEDGSNG